MHLMFHRDSLRKIAETAISKKTGARGLRRILETLLNDSLYEFPETAVRYVVVDANLNVKGYSEEDVGEALSLAGKVKPPAPKDI